MKTSGNAQNFTAIETLKIKALNMSAYKHPGYLLHLVAKK